MAETELKEFDSDDLGEIVTKVENSFGIEPDLYRYKNVRTLGELCSEICSAVKGVQLDDCSSQQAFYKIRRAISVSSGIEKEEITRDSRLESMFPTKGRRQAVRHLRKSSGLPLKILKPKDWISNTALLFLLLSLIGLAFNWRLALAMLVVDILAMRLIDRFGKEFRVSTVGEAATLATRESYKLARRNPNSVNRREIEAFVLGTFVEDLGWHESLA